jgi:hypothetical protein
VPEAAEFFAGAEAWDEGLENLFGRGERARLRVFLEQNPAQAKAHEKLEAVLKLDESTALKDLPEDLRRELIACAAWAQLAEGSAPARWRGELVDAAILRSWVGGGAQRAGARVRGGAGVVGGAGISGGFAGGGADVAAQFVRDGRRTHEDAGRNENAVRIQSRRCGGGAV